MRHNAAILLSLGAGALLMFYLDPARGRRRRALVRDKLVRAAGATSEAIDETRNDLGNRLQGLKARWHHVNRDEAVDDAVLTDRVRAELGRHTEHARNITVSVCDGEVILTGLVTTAEAKRVERATWRVPGVCKVVNLIDTDESITVARGARMTVPLILLAATGAMVAARAARPLLRSA
jgi:hypothetical protein